jgi:ABC-type dipeptide/oligopeptide/nickel transport system permease component
MMLGDYATPELVEQMRHNLGLDRPLHVQYVDFLLGVARGDLGRSMRSGQQVWFRIADAFPYTLTLAVASLLIGSVAGVGAGVVAAVRRYSLTDNVAMVFSMVAYSMPAFYIGILMLLVFSLRLEWFPVLGTGDIADPRSLLVHLALPALANGLRQAGLIARMTRSELVEIMYADYIRTARAKGLKERVVVLRHALKNGAIPVVTVIGLTMGRLLGGAVVTEIVFTRKGLGRLLVEAVFTRDYPMVQGVILVWALAFVVVNLVVDVVYGYLDPRITYS